MAIIQTGTGTIPSAILFLFKNSILLINQKYFNVLIFLCRETNYCVVLDKIIRSIHLPEVTRIYHMFYHLVLTFLHSCPVFFIPVPFPLQSPPSLSQSPSHPLAHLPSTLPLSFASRPPPGPTGPSAGTPAAPTSATRGPLLPEGREKRLFPVQLS